MCCDSRRPPPPRAFPPPHHSISASFNLHLFNSFLTLFTLLRRKMSDNSFNIRHLRTLAKTTEGASESSSPTFKFRPATRQTSTLTPLESALTQSARVTPLESALTIYMGGWGAYCKLFSI